MRSESIFDNEYTWMTNPMVVTDTYHFFKFSAPAVNVCYLNSKYSERREFSYSIFLNKSVCGFEYKNGDIEHQFEACK